MRTLASLLARRASAAAASTSRGVAGDALVWPPPEGVALPPGVREALTR